MSHTKPTSDAYTNARPNAYTESTALAADDMFQAYDTSAAANRKFSAATLRQDIPNTQTDSYQLVLGDAGKTIYMNKGTANTLTIPTFVTVAFPTNTVIGVIRLGAGATTIDAADGVTLNGVASGGGAMDGQYKAMTLIKTAENTWLAIGSIGTVA